MSGRSSSNVKSLRLYGESDAIPILQKHRDHLTPKSFAAWLNKQGWLGKLAWTLARAPRLKHKCERSDRFWMLSLAFQGSLAFTVIARQAWCLQNCASDPSPFLFFTGGLEAQQHPARRQALVITAPPPL